MKGIENFMENEKIELELKRFEELQHGSDKYIQFIKVCKAINELKEYKDTLSNELLNVIDDYKITQLGTIKRYKGGITTTLDKECDTFKEKYATIYNIMFSECNKQTIGRDYFKVIAKKN